jgi:hypothetical protein
VTCNPDFVDSWGCFHVRFFCLDGREYTDKEVLSGSNLSIVWSIVLGLEQTQLASADDGFGAVLSLQFVEDSQVMTLDRAEGQV